MKSREFSATKRVLRVRNAMTLVDSFLSDQNHASQEEATVIFTYSPAQDGASDNDRL